MDFFYAAAPIVPAAGEGLLRECSAARLERFNGETRPDFGEAEADMDLTMDFRH